MAATINKPSLDGLRCAIAGKLVQIEKLLPKEYRLTLIARHVSNEEAHIVVSDDDLNLAIGAVEKLERETAAIERDQKRKRR